MFFGADLNLNARGLLRAAFPCWLAVFGAATGIVAVAGATGPAISIQFKILSGL